MRRYLITLIALIFAAAPALATERVALVVGMARYAHVPALKNTVNDASVIATTLEGIGFKVLTLTDATQQEFEATLDQFAFQAETADLALIYFAGHGVEVGGENFLIPVDAKVASSDEVAEKSVSLKQMLAAVDKARKMRIVILDSCRDNPFGDVLTESTSGGINAVGAASRGLAPPSPDRGTLVAFAARDGEVALDGQGDNSPFATALANTMRLPDVEISIMFRMVRDQVLDATRNAQEPNTYGSLSGIPFYLAGQSDRPETPQTEDRVLAWAGTPPETLTQFRSLADEGDTRSMLNLAYVKINANARDTYDRDGAIAYLEQAASLGSAEAQNYLAGLYEKGLGVAVDYSRALQLYEEAAAQNYADAINDLGFLHYQGGLGLTRDPQRALSYFERAADLRHPQAMFNFAALIDDGLIPTKTSEDAAGYLYEALRSGSEDVLNVLLENPRMFKPETRRALQRKLSEFDFYQGTIDGDIGPGTKRGIRAAYGLTE